MMLSGGNFRLLIFFFYEKILHTHTHTHTQSSILILRIQVKFPKCKMYPQRWCVFSRVVPTTSVVQAHTHTYTQEKKHKKHKNVKQATPFLLDVFYEHKKHKKHKM